MAESGGELQDRLDLWIERLKQVDRVLTKPVKSLIWLYGDWKSHGAELSKPGSLPAYVTAETESPVKAMLIHAIACGTIQRLYNRRRRYQWLSDEEKDQLIDFQETLPAAFLPPFDPKDPLKMVEAFEDDMFGALNPLTSAEIFWVLIKSGEANAHRGAGFLMLFSIFWSLFRTIDGAFEGARLDPWRPTASVTARCLAPLGVLVQILERRARSFGDVIAACQNLEQYSAGSSQRDRWLFTVALERLSKALHDLAELAINSRDFVDCSHLVAGLAEQITPRSDVRPIWGKVREELTSVLRNLCRHNKEVLGEASLIRREVIGEVVRALKGDAQQREKLASRCRQIQYQFVRPDHLDAYWDDLRDAAQRADKAIGELIEALEEAEGACALLPAAVPATPEAIVKTLQPLKQLNEKVARKLEDLVRPHIEWMRRIMTQEVAYASAGDSTFFDAAELLSSLIAVERWKKASGIEISDAIGKVVQTGRRDGSWSAGQPIYLIKRALGVWPTTPDIFWLLVSAVAGEPEIDCADEAIFRSVGWLEKMQLQVKRKTAKGIVDLRGWSSEIRETDRIDLWSTCVSINALLEVRDLIEHRVWQICEKRFVVRREIDLTPLDMIDPVDLAAVHKRRVHRRLMRMARETTEHGSKTGMRNAPKSRRGGEGDPIDYSFVLHGPPGSSKTAIAEAVGREMWAGVHGERRFIRITPADFTRGGESRLDAEARFIFDLLMHVRGVTVFFDEIDDLLRTRAAGKEPTFLKLIVPAMLNRLQDLRDAAPRQQICFLLATNYIDNIEPALTRPGRIDAIIAVPYPDAWSRQNLMERYLRRDLERQVRDAIIQGTSGWPWSTFKSLCKRLSAASDGLGMQFAEATIKELETEFERMERYYFDPDRWRSSSRPLMTELVQTALSLSYDKEVCRAKIAELTRMLTKAEVDLARLPFMDEFEAEWKRQQRP
jgi:hypothetical protein